RRGAVDMHGAGAAQRHAAAEFRPGHAEHVAEHPEQRRIAVHVDAARTSIDGDGKGHVPLLSLVGLALLLDPRDVTAARDDGFYQAMMIVISQIKLMTLTASIWAAAHRFG